jgi:hypothetical protein
MVNVSYRRKLHPQPCLPLPAEDREREARVVTHQKGTGKEVRLPFVY